LPLDAEGRPVQIDIGPVVGASRERADRAADFPGSPAPGRPCFYQPVSSRRISRDGSTRCRRY
jgi:hypothetical protein